LIVAIIAVVVSYLYFSNYNAAQSKEGFSGPILGPSPLQTSQNDPNTVLDFDGVQGLPVNGFEDNVSRTGNGNCASFGEDTGQLASTWGLPWKKTAPTSEQRTPLKASDLMPPSADVEVDTRNYLQANDSSKIGLITSESRNQTRDIRGDLPIPKRSLIFNNSDFEYDPCRRRMEILSSDCSPIGNTN
ncbi:hypothetical protein HDU93_004763, partial [Gonapodya sp. JEL0774]